MKRFILGFAFLWSVCISAYSQAAGYAGLSYETYRGTGANPSTNPLVYPTALSTGVSPTINFNWGGNMVLNSGRSEQVIVRWTGFINIPEAGLYSFGGNADDGLRITINNTSVVNSWIESGGAFRSGNVSLPAGVVPVEIWYYENGGGAMVNFQWYVQSTGTWQIVPSTMLATDSTFWAPQAPTLCCGGSNASFSRNTTHVSKVQAFSNRTTGDSQISIEQIGNLNTIEVNQTGTNQNFLSYTGNGSSNNITVNQSGNSSTQVNYIELGVNGNSNTVNLTQQSTGGSKSIFATVNDNNNSLIVQQKDSGSHYLNVTLSGGNKNVDVLQQGSASHMANISLSGNATGLNLSQSGSTQQFYSITHTCSTAGGCGTITVQQGQ